ncbi:hypothetical protein K7432_001398 [Basidiobolus ranarum]|uniref:beta-N-acetylhexosaminidase n=1 Tax=Basidiobolus ranarum TaxID=34480 RepID=A0ABR2W9P7_9FUNG
MPFLQKTSTFFKKALYKAKDVLGEEDSGNSQTPPGSRYDTPQQYPCENAPPVVPPRPGLTLEHQFQVIPTPKNETKHDHVALISLGEVSVEINCNSSWLLGNALVLKAWLQRILNAGEERIVVTNEFLGGGNPQSNIVNVSFNLQRFGDASMDGRYRVVIDAQQRQVTIDVQNPEGAAYAVSTLVQLLEERTPNEFIWPNIIVEDWPSTPDEYRGLMLDVAREYHSIEHLQSIIDLCSLYKLRYLHLHLTDNENFMIPSPSPEFYNGVDLSEIGKAIHNVHGEPAYTIQELKDLNLYAFTRGVILVPEFDIPGHSEALIRSSPELLGTYSNDGQDRIRSVVNFANETVLNCVILPMLSHVAKLFPYSPYIHIGFDEVDVTDADEDPHFQRAINRKHHISSDKELLWDFMGFMNYHVRNLNIHSCYSPPTLPGSNIPADLGFYQPTRRSIVWESFAAHSTPLPPKDILIMTWSMQDYQPDHLIRDGYSIINGAWSPLYVVGTDGSSVKDILKWQGSCEFGGIPERGRKTKWVTLPKEAGAPYSRGPRVHGASIVVWESEVEKEIHCLKGRLGAMSERLWTQDTFNAFGNHMLPQFEARLSRIDRLIELICETN